MRGRYNNNHEPSSEEEYAHMSGEDGEEEEYMNEKSPPRTNMSRRRGSRSSRGAAKQEDTPSMHLRDRRKRVSYAEVEASDYDDEEEVIETTVPVRTTPRTSSRRRRVATQVKQASGDAQYSTRSRRQTKRINYREMDDLQIDPEDIEEEQEYVRPRRNTRKPAKYEDEEESSIAEPSPSPLRRSSRKRAHPKSYIEDEGSEDNVDEHDRHEDDLVVPVSKRSRIQYHAPSSSNSSGAHNHERTTISDETHTTAIRQNESTVIVETESTTTEVTSLTNNGQVYERAVENGHVIITAAYNGALANATDELESAVIDQTSASQKETNSSDQEDPIDADPPQRTGQEAAYNSSQQKNTPTQVQNERGRRQRRKEDSDGEYEPEPIAPNEEEEEQEHESEEEEEEDGNSGPAKRARTARNNNKSAQKQVSEEEDEDEEAAYIRRQRRAPTRTRTRRYSRRSNPPSSEEEEASDDEPLKNRLRPRNQKQVNPYTHYISNLASQSQAAKQKSPSRYEELQAKYAKQRSEIMRQIPPSPQTTIPQTNAFISDDSSDSSDEDVPPPGGVPASSGGMATKSDVSKSDKYSHIAPINLNELNAHKKGRPSADIDPMKVGKVGWDQIGGLQHHVDALKEMVVLPLLYPEVFQKFDITPPRGVIFFGPPGTGKTLVARALANTCSHGARPIAFFMRKGADILSKWVGEAEKQLRLLFDEAKKLQPSIIFFDEIDGLAPVRSSKQDYIHSSIVSTLLALMDGLDNRGQVVVIGATNRIDSIDPALRRPGRFDRELIFTLPSKSARKEIFDIHTKNWNPSVPRELVEDIAKRCVGYCGADLKALCAEAALCALKRKYPQVYSSTDRLLIDVNSIQVQKIDFLDAMKSITPASHRSAVVHSRPLPTHLVPLLTDKMDNIKNIVKQIFPLSTKHFERHDEVKPQLLQIENGNSDDNMTDDTEEEEISTDNFTSFADISFMDHNVSDYMINPPAYRPWLLIYGSEGMGQLLLARAILYSLEELALFSLDFASLITNQNVRTAEEALISTFAEARKNSPSVLWIPNIDEWWDKSSEVLQSTFCSMLQDLPSSLNILVIATVNNCKMLSELPLPIQKLFNEHHYHVKAPTKDHRQAMFSIFIKDVLRKPLVKQKKHKNKIYPELPKAPLPPVEVRREQLISEEEDIRVRREEEHFLRELRIRLRDPMLRILTNKRYEIFAKPPRPAQNGSGANPSTSSDNGTTSSNPDNLLYLYDILDNLERRKYESLKSFNSDIKQIVKDSALYQSNVDDFATTRNVSKALQLYETLKSMYQHLPQPLVKKCAQIAKRRQRLAKEKAELEKANQAAQQQQAESASASGSETNVVQPSESQQNGEGNGDVEMTDGPLITADVTPNSNVQASVSLLAEMPNSEQPMQQNPSASENVELSLQHQQPEEDLPSVPDVVIDQEALHSWFEDFITITEGSTVEELDKHFSQLYKTLYKYRFTENRNPLIIELKEFLNTLRTLEEFR